MCKKVSAEHVLSHNMHAESYTSCAQNVPAAKQMSRRPAHFWNVSAAASSNSDLNSGVERYRSPAQQPSSSPLPRQRAKEKELPRSSRLSG